ncbi:MAG: gluzincin family metallopeptidase, partial [Planctomycetota bacterium]
MKKFIIVTLAALSVFIQNSTFAQTRERSEIPQNDTWNLTDISTSDEQWEKDKQNIVEQFDIILPFKGKLADSPSELLACLQLNSQISKEFGRLYSYASMKSDEDIGNSKRLGMKQQMQQLGTDYNSKSSFIDPEVAEMDKNTIDKFISEEPKLKIYKMYLYNIQRTKAHRLSEKEEKILAEAGLLASGPYSIYGILSNAELPYPEITLSDGKTVTLNKAEYALYRALPNRHDREAVFQAFWETFNKFKGTFGTQLYANVKTDMFYARTR